MLKGKREIILDLSIKSQMEVDKKVKAAYLIGMLKQIAKGTKYEQDVMDAINDYYKNTAFDKREYNEE